MCTALAVLRLAQDNPSEATTALAPALDGSAPLVWPPLAGSGLRAGSDCPGRSRCRGRGRAGARAHAGPGRARRSVLVVLLDPAPGLLARQTRHRTAHAALIAEIRGLLAGNKPAPRGARPRPLQDPLSQTSCGCSATCRPTSPRRRSRRRAVRLAEHRQAHVRNLFAKLAQTAGPGRRPRATSACSGPPPSGVKPRFARRADPCRLTGRFVVPVLTVEETRPARRSGTSVVCASSPERSFPPTRRYRAPGGRTWSPTCASAATSCSLAATS